MKLIVLSALLLAFCALNAQANLEISIHDLKDDRGNILLELLDSNEETLKAIVQKIDTLPFYVSINNLQPGTYAVKFFHDSNSNGQLDMNWMGIPKEGFGFSNNAYGMFMPKKFEEWLFEVNGDMKIELIPKYLLK